MVITNLVYKTCILSPIFLSPSHVMGYPLKPIKSSAYHPLSFYHYVQMYRFQAVSVLMIACCSFGSSNWVQTSNRGTKYVKAVLCLSMMNILRTQPNMTWSKSITAKPNNRTSEYHPKIFSLALNYIGAQYKVNCFFFLPLNFYCLSLSSHFFSGE